MLTLTIASLVVAAVSVIYAMNMWHRVRSGPVASSTDPAAAGWNALERELRRARRSGHPLAVNRIVPRGAAPSDVAASIRTRLRTTDLYFASRSCVYVTMPDATAADARCAMRRLCEPIEESGVSCRIESATFPEDALTTGALIAQLSPEGLESSERVES